MPLADGATFAGYTIVAKALAKDPKDRFERCADFARALDHRLGSAVPGDGGGTTIAPLATPQEPSRWSPLRAGVVLPAILAILLVAAIAVAIFEFRRADRPEAAAPATTTTTSPTTTTTTTAPAPPVAVIGANCSPVGSTGTTGSGSTAYCSTLQTTGASIWSLNQGDIPSPTATTEPIDEPLPFLDESPVRVCMQQTGQTRRECRDDIRRSNGLPPLP